MDTLELTGRILELARNSGLETDEQSAAMKAARIILSAEGEFLQVSQSELSSVPTN